MGAERTRPRGARLGWLALPLWLACSEEPPARAPAAPAPQAVLLQRVLEAPAGQHALDARIRELQARIPNSSHPERVLEQLGWLFIARARELNHTGSFQLALDTALALEGSEPNSHAALLLHGHALHSLHRFAEAERIARRLVGERGLPFDHGLLGDVLFDRGELPGAIAAYQRMVDERPDLHSYARAAQVRWLTGDLDGAQRAMQRAVQAASPRNRESYAWAWTRLAHYQLQAGANEPARQSVERALSALPESPSALKVQASLWLSEGQPERAVAPLQAAIGREPHPELLWMLSEIEADLGHRAQSAALSQRLMREGEREDPRAFALYLASSGGDLALAERLLQRELRERADVYTHEALAWVLSARGEHARALDHARSSLAHGTPDVRLYYHAGLVASAARELPLARGWLRRASERSELLLPSQQKILAQRRL
jgi:tetratricopeptide (TPR) repeat protein